MSSDGSFQAMERDKANGLTPFFVSTTLGTTSSCSFDKLLEIGPVTKSFPSVWLHVDGAYAGNSFICPENRHLMAGIHHADSFNTNSNKWLLVCFDCSCLWVKDKVRLTTALVVDPLYLQHANSNEVIDYRHWGVPLSRRFRALKLWFVLRRYGIEGLQAYIRNHCRLAKIFESLVLKDDRFEVVNEVQMGLVCFLLKGSDKLNQDLLASINGSGKLHMIPSLVRGRYIIRFCVTAKNATEGDIDHAWEVIQTHATDLLDSVRTSQTRPNMADVKGKWRTLSRRLSFTRSVSKELYRRTMTRTSLFDGATPIIVPDDDVIDDVFYNVVTIGEEEKENV